MTSGMKGKWVELNPCYMLRAGFPGVAHRFKEMSVPAIHVRLWATRGNRAQTPGLGMHSVLRALACWVWRLGTWGYHSDSFNRACGKWRLPWSPSVNSISYILVFNFFVCLYEFKNANIKESQNISLKGILNCSKTTYLLRKLTL